MNRWFAAGTILCSLFMGCQFVSGVNDLEVVESGELGDGGSGGSKGDGGTAGSGGTATGGSQNEGGSGGSMGSGGSAGSGGSGGSNASGGSGGSGGSGASGGSGGTGGGNNCSDQPNWQCDILTNCGCDEETENCGYDVSVDAAVCGDLGTGQPYDDCTVNADCQRGYGCIAGVCKKHCDEANTCGWDNAACLEIYDGEDVIQGIGFCSAECDPIDPSEPLAGGMACGDNATCYPYADDEGNLAHTVCIGTDGDGQQGDSCADADGNADFSLCAPGYFCSSLTNTCRRYCQMGGADCADGGSCVSFNPPAFLGDDELGTCFTCDTGDFECSVYPECGCGASEACKITDFVSGATECVAAGSVPAWGACEVQEDCAPSAGACVSGFCHPFCREPGSDTCDTGDCFQAYSNNEPIPGAYYCNAPCEPVLADRSAATNVKSCPGSTLCLPVTYVPTDLDTGAYCSDSGAVEEGGYCTLTTDCADGLGCIYDQCTPWCRRDSDCTAAFPTCYFLDPARYAAPGDEIGLCLQAL